MSVFLTVKRGPGVDAVIATQYKPVEDRLPRSDRPSGALAIPSSRFPVHQFYDGVANGAIQHENGDLGNGSLPLATGSVFLVSKRGLERSFGADAQAPGQAGCLASPSEVESNASVQRGIDDVAPEETTPVDSSLLKRLVRTIAAGGVHGRKPQKREPRDHNSPPPESLAILAEAILEAIANGKPIDEQQALGLARATQHLRISQLADEVLQADAHDRLMRVLRLAESIVCLTRQLIDSDHRAADRHNVGAQAKDRSARIAGRRS